MKCETLDELKEEYEKLRDKYDLPSYTEINNDFEISRLYEHQTDTLIRDVRKIMLEKIGVYSRFIEMILNPSSSSVFLFKIIKNLNSERIKLLEEIYKTLGKIEIESILVDLNFSEEVESEFIKKVFNEWRQIKQNLSSLIGLLINGTDKKFDRKMRGYLR